MGRAFGLPDQPFGRFRGNGKEIEMKTFTLGAAFASLVLASTAQAAPIVLTGNYLKVGISDYGTFGSNGNTQPAFVHDPTGTGTFDASTDYISPGSPHDGFSLVSDQFAFASNDNNGVSDWGFLSPTLLVGAAANGYANAASWTSGNSFLTLTNSYFFNPGDERVLVVTTITALSNLTNLAFARSVDPDSGTTSSINQRGNTTFSADDFVGSESTANGRTLALVNLDAGGLSHTTQINSACCSNINPYDVLSHSAAAGDLGMSSVGDDGLNLAYLIGNLTTGSSVTLRYAYAAGLGLDSTGGPTTPGAVPEPATWAMMIAGFGLVGGAMRRRVSKVRFA
jgi:PEP-CTERM motif